MWRRLSRCYEQTALGALTWLEVAYVAYPCGWLFEYGEYDWETFCARKDEIQQQLSHLAEAAAKPETVDLEWCEAHLIDLVSAWEAADSGQQSRLVAGIFEQLEAEALPDGTIRAVAIPRGAWRPFFAGLVLERETGFEPATSTLARSRSTK
jgi:hypothetical protein